MDPLSITLAVALGFAVFAFGVLVGSLVSLRRHRKKAALASMQDAMHAPPAGATPHADTPDAAVQPLAAPAAPSAEPVAPAVPVAEPTAPVAAGIELPAPALGSEMAASGGGLESLLAEVAQTDGGIEALLERASAQAVEEEQPDTATELPGYSIGLVPEVVLESEPEPLGAVETELASDAGSGPDTSWEPMPEAPATIELLPVTAAAPENEIAAPEELSWGPVPEATSTEESDETTASTPEIVWQLEPEAVLDEGLDTAPAPEVEWQVEPDVSADEEPETEAEPEVVWNLEPEAVAPAAELSWELTPEVLPTFEPAPAAEIATEAQSALSPEAVAEPAPISEPDVLPEFAWELSPESDEPVAEALAPEPPMPQESELTWVMEPEVVLPPLLETPIGVSEITADELGGEQVPESETEPSWLLEPTEGEPAGGPEWPTVAEPASVQGTVPEPDFTWPPAEIDSGLGVGIDVAAPVTVDEAIAPAGDRPRAHVRAIPDGSPEREPDAVAPREALPMPQVTAESIDMVAPVQMWFGDYAVAVKAGSKTHTQFRKYADVLLGELKDAKERNR